MSSLCDKSFDRSFAPHQNNEKKSFVLFCRMLVTNDKNDIRKMRKALWACVKCSFANTSRAYCAFLHAFVRFGTIFLWFTHRRSRPTGERDLCGSEVFDTQTPIRCVFACIAYTQLNCRFRRLHAARKESAIDSDVAYTGNFYPNDVCMDING